MKMAEYGESSSYYILYTDSRRMKFHASIKGHTIEATSYSAISFFMCVHACVIDIRQ